ncbi:MAG: hypothetical protein ACI9XO_003580 [Paraglaciecola sp.]
MATFVNWDVFITRFNLTAETKNGIDVQFLLFDVSDKNLYLLEDNLDLLVEKSASPGFQHRKSIRDRLDKKRSIFERKQKEISGLSWNYADARNVKKK